MAGESRIKKAGLLIYYLMNLCLALADSFAGQWTSPLTTLPLPGRFFLLDPQPPRPTASRGVTTRSFGEKYSIPVIYLYIHRNVPRKMYCFEGWVFLFAVWLVICLYLSYGTYIEQIPKSKTAGSQVMYNKKFTCYQQTAHVIHEIFLQRL